MAERTQPFEEIYTIVIGGVMNPRLHHPLWYHIIGLLSASDLDIAVKREELTVDVQYARFDAPDFTVACDPDSWTIQTTKREARARVVEVAKRVFERLHETPIQTYSCYNEFQIRTSQQNVAAFLATRLVAAGFSLNLAGAAEARAFVQTTGANGDVVAMRVEPSVKAPNAIFIGIGATHRVKAEQSGHFELSPLLDDAFDRDYGFALQQATNALEQLSLDALDAHDY